MSGQLLGKVFLRIVCALGLIIIENETKGIVAIRRVKFDMQKIKTPFA